MKRNNSSNGKGRDRARSSSDNRGGRSQGDRPHSGRSRSERPKGGRPQSGRSRSDRPSSDRPQTGRPQTDRPRSERSQSDRAGSDRPNTGRSQSGSGFKSDRKSGFKLGGKRFKPHGSKSGALRDRARRIGNTTPETAAPVDPNKELIRLNRYIATAGVCSRREADALITAGAVTVNGEIVTELGTKVKRSDTVQVGGDTLRAEKLQYVLLNKPKDYITTVTDPRNRKTVMELVRKACKERIYPVGRLDRATTGLLLLTNDGDLTKKLTHPKHGVQKIYRVQLNKNVKLEHLEALREGIELEDGPIKVDEVNYAKGEVDKKTLGIELHSGRNRIIRRMMEHLGYRVVALDRVSFAGLTKKQLPKGKFRKLTDREIGFLKML